MSVDVETDGPIPGDYSLLSIGACVVGGGHDFYVEMKPISGNFEKEALKVSGLNRQRLSAYGVDPGVAMKAFDVWVKRACNRNKKPVFVGLNAPFDWMFVHWYFVHFLRNDPFGHTALDIKSYYAGATGERLWAKTSKSKVARKFLPGKTSTHNALEDARQQAEMFRRLKSAVSSIRKPIGADS